MSIRVSIRPLAVLGLTLVLGTFSAGAGQNVLHVYGSEGPSPAIQEAARTFGTKYHVNVDVVSGPVTKWLDQAKADADVIFCSAEFMMSELVRGGELGIDSASITPLYLRPSAILVRPGNPKAIRDFPDLLRPGVRVMVVTGSGQTGLWEDMAGKQGDIRTIREFRDNIALFAPDSETAMSTWQQRDDIDAWVTWNVWCIPLRDQADLVPVSDQYRIYRQCNIAVTERGKAKPLAAQFIEFLTSPEGAKIFSSWEWMPPPADATPLAVRRDIAIVCRVDQNNWRDGVGSALGDIRGLVEHYKTIGVPENELHICAVFHGPAAYWLLKDKPYQAFTKHRDDNPNKSIVSELVGLGVSMEMCAQTMKEHGWREADLLPGVKTVVGACPRIVDLELQGYAYWRF